jgi:hypothetical protein
MIPEKVFHQILALGDAWREHGAQPGGRGPKNGGSELKMSGARLCGSFARKQRDFPWQATNAVPAAPTYADDGGLGCRGRHAQRS